MNISFSFFVSIQIKEVAPLTRNQRQLWKHDIKVARNFNRTSNGTTTEDHASKQLVDKLELRRREDSLRSVYRDTYQNTWSPMTSEFDSIWQMGAPMTNRFDEPRYLQSQASKRRNTLPYSSGSQFSSHISSLRAVNRFQLEKIPEVVVTSSNGEDEQNKNNEPSPSTSMSEYDKIAVAPTDTSDSS